MLFGSKAKGEKKVQPKTESKVAVFEPTLVVPKKKIPNPASAFEPTMVIKRKMPVIEPT
jgi:hypothetical protein